MRSYRICHSNLLLTLIFSWAGTALWGNFTNIYAQTLEQLAPKSFAQLRSTTLFFGEPIRFTADIANESRIPLSELKISTKCMGDEPVHAPYGQPFVGAIIPGYARKVDVEFYRMQAKSTSATKQLLWSHTYEVQQIPPTFDATAAVIENAVPKGKLPKLGECSFVIKGIKVDFAKPVDVENNRIVKALVNDLEVADPMLDTVKTSLQFFSGMSPDEKLSQALKPQSIALSGFFDSGVFLINASIRGLPKSSLKGKTLRGVIAIKLYVKLQNRRAMRSAIADETLLIPCSIPF